ncbi:hypothetical protein LIER_13259 [Lithospermum erythrorhizon]|uniref:Uncharacterized protein n=1 Tax=Lithospermum erythrorhizon TaxID=34254 RepID=A0AAV3PUT3_LITER
MEDKKRRKSKGGNDESCSSKKKKDRTPQRGLGVATLERLRVQENLKQMTQNTNNLPFDLFMDSSSMNNNNVVVPGVPFPPTFGTFEGIHNNNNNNKVEVGLFFGDQEGLFVQRVGGFNGLFSGKNCVGFSGVGLGNGSNVNKNEASNELSSTPLSFFGLSDKCGFCHKKKRVDAKVANQAQAVEVVAVHRKGGPCGGGVMMEYEFFPEKGGRNCSSSTSVVEELMRSGGVESSSSIDLTLKLY